jgi:formiminoglutamase
MANSIEHWLKPFVAPEAQYQPWQWGQNLASYKGKSLTKGQYHLALVGVGISPAETQASALIRRQLYKMAFNLSGLKAIDMGDVQGNDTGIAEVLEYLINLHITPILIGGTASQAMGQFKAYEQSNKALTLSVVANKVPFRISPKPESEEPLLNQILQHQPGKLYQFQQIGYQSHFTDPAALDFLSRNHHELLRLGKVRDQMECTEPIVRDTDLLVFNLNVVRYNEAPSAQGVSPSGLFTEEACRIARYAGMSNHLSSIGFYGLQPDPERQDDITAQTAAQLIWYFVDGLTNRKLEDLNNPNLSTNFVVDLKDENLQIHFKKSMLTERWWMEIPSSGKSTKKTNRWISCTYEDYIMSTKGELPERLFKVIHR